MNDKEKSKAIILFIFALIIAFCLYTVSTDRTITGTVKEITITRGAVVPGDGMLVYDDSEIYIYKLTNGETVKYTPVGWDMPGDTVKIGDIIKAKYLIRNKEFTRNVEILEAAQ